MRKTIILLITVSSKGSFEKNNEEAFDLKSKLSLKATFLVVFLFVNFVNSSSNSSKDFDNIGLSTLSR